MEALAAAEQLTAVLNNMSCSSQAAAAVMFGGGGTTAPASGAMATNAPGSAQAAALAEVNREASPEAKARSSDDSEVACDASHFSDSLEPYLFTCSSLDLRTSIPPSLLTMSVQRRRHKSCCRP